jgi:CO/xanthine dehydrogenase Mo-binding subunit
VFDGGFTLNVGFMDVGEGSSTVVLQMAADTLGVLPQMIRLNSGNTDNTPESPMTAGSTLTFSAGQAAVRAANQLASIVIEAASEAIGSTDTKGLYITPEGVCSMNGDGVKFADLARKAGLLKTAVSVTPGSKDYIVNSFGAHFAEIEVDIETGYVKIIKYVAVHDSGRIINPKMAVGQVRGGISQMMGFTFLEDMELDHSRNSTTNLTFGHFWINYPT